jgi:hypothetical protein
MDAITLPHLRHLKVTVAADAFRHSAPCEDILTRMTLPSLDRVSVACSYVEDEDKKLLLRPFASAKEREILEVTMKKADYSWLFE